VIEWKGCSFVTSLAKYEFFAMVGGFIGRIPFAGRSIPSSTISKLREFHHRLCQVYEVSGKRSRDHSMEGLRGFAVLLVFCVHFHALFSRQLLGIHSSVFSVAEFFATVGYAGVDLFFLISGYMIYGMLIDRGIPYRKFIRRRAERIYPTFLVVFGIYLILSFLFPSENKIVGSGLDKTIYIVENLLLIPGVFDVKPIITVAWTLSYELLFYLTLPIIVRMMRRFQWERAGRVIFFLALGTGVLVFWGILLPSSHIRIFMFVAGILVFEARHSGEFSGILNRTSEYFTILLVIGSLLVTYWSVKKAEMYAFSVAGDGNFYYFSYSVVATSVSFFLMILLCLEFRGIIQTMFTWMPLRYLGNMSYSYYLIHGVTLKGISLVLFSILEPVNAPLIFVTMLVTSLILTWVTSTFLFMWVEKPLSLKPRFV
jgi:exopolysaccharide production protein ExoZ